MSLVKAVVYMHKWVAYQDIDITRAAAAIMSLWARLNNTGTSIPY